MGIFLSLTLSVVATGVLSDLWSKEWSTLRLSFQVTHHSVPLRASTSSLGTLHFVTCACSVSPTGQVTAPFLHLGGVILMTALAWPVASHLFRMNSRGGELSSRLHLHFSLFSLTLFAN